MTKDLSRQLAELGNIPPVYKYQISFKQDDGELITFPVWGKEALTQQIRPRVKVVKVDKLYPSFESPENFVKLLECYFETVDGVVNYHKREEFITYIIEIAKDNNKLKQALQATDWVY